MAEAAAPDFHEYLKKQLIDYIKAEQAKGVPLEEIERILLDVGHHRNIIAECFAELKNEEVGKAADMPADETKKDLVADVKSSLKNFFGQLKTERQVQAVKKETTSEEEVKIIEEAVDEVRTEQRTFLFEGILFFLYLVALVVMALFTAGSTGDDFTRIAIGFSASFINTFVSFAAMSLAANVPIYVFIPVIISTIFYAIGNYGGIQIFRTMDIETLGIINVTISMFFNILVIYLAFLKPKTEVTVVEETVETAPEQPAAPVQPASRPASHHTAKYEKKEHRHIEALRKEFNLPK